MAAVVVPWIHSRRCRQMIAFAFGSALPTQQQQLVVFVGGEEPGETGEKRRGRDLVIARAVAKLEHFP